MEANTINPDKTAAKAHKQMKEQTTIAMDGRTRVKFERRHEISNNVVSAPTKGSDQPVHTRRLIRVFASRLKVL